MCWTDSGDRSSLVVVYPTVVVGRLVVGLLCWPAVDLCLRRYATSCARLPQPPWEARLAAAAASTAAIGVRPSETRGRPGAARRFAAAGGGAGSK